MSAKVERRAARALAAERANLRIPLELVRTRVLRPRVARLLPGSKGGLVYIGIPEIGLLIAFTGGNYADRVLFRPQRNFVPEDILPAVRRGTGM